MSYGAYNDMLPVIIAIMWSQWLWLKF